MNADVGGGTAKIAVCANGEVIALTALDVGARLVCTDAAGRIVRIEEAGRHFAKELGFALELGGSLSEAQARALAAPVSGRLIGARRGGPPRGGDTGVVR